jgi:hypothetical protein
MAFINNNGPLYFTWKWNVNANLQTSMNWYFRGDTYGSRDTASARGDDNRYGYYRCSAGAPGTITAFTIQISPSWPGKHAQ